ncbi:MAG: dTDP-4-dehydrorhamnose 3,5-epimerase, partial [Flavobacteriales bacterium]|nr:dTDP-4-dehydrorhamnose 3,5-epimerase [Flavobacteriales bacterium]
MEVIPTGFDGLFEIRPKIFEDDRGWFMESFNEDRYVKDLGLTRPFVQDNISSSGLHSLRGLHFQSPPYAQSKLVMVTEGMALDVVVDIRGGSATYGKHYKVILDAEKKNQLFVPRGFAHGFLSLEEGTIFQYKCDNLYNKDHECTLQWNDP